MSNIKKINNHTIIAMSSMPNQQGIALVITLIVLLVLTILGVASTDSNQLQAALVRNNQFRLETFNASYSEIDAQIDEINLNTTISGGLPDNIDFLIKQQNQTINNVDNSDLILIQANHPKMSQSVDSSYAGNCIKPGFAIGANKEIFDCHIIEIGSSAQLLDGNGDETNIVSNQRQRYEFETFADN